MNRISQIAATVILGVAGTLLGQTLPSGGDVGDGVPKFDVRPGYKVTLAVKGLKAARMMEVDEYGTLYVTQPNAGKIIALRDNDGDGVYETQSDFVTGHKSVHGLHYYKGELWFTESGAIFKTKPTPDGKAGEIQTVIPDGELPKGGGHWFRPILVTDDYFYTSMGDDGNANEPTADPKVPHREDREKIWRYKLDGSDKTLWSSGIRNTEKLRLRPGTEEVWGADHGSDNIGYNWGDQKGDQPITDWNPPEELNHYVQGGFYGHPYFEGLRMPRPEFMNRPELHDLANKTIPPEWSGGAHWANNGWCFLTKNYFPDSQGDIFIAYHGSWDRNPRGGYCVQRILFDKVTGKPYGALTIVSTLTNDGKDLLDRPVDCVETPDGSVLFSSDQPTNNVYRISHK